MVKKRAAHTEEYQDDMSPGSIFNDLTPYEKVLVALLKSAVEDKDTRFIKGETFGSICRYFRTNAEKMRISALKAVKYNRRGKIHRKKGK